MIFQFMLHNIDYAEEWEEGEARAGQGREACRCGLPMSFCGVKQSLINAGRRKRKTLSPDKFQFHSIAFQFQ